MTNQANTTLRAQYAGTPARFNPEVIDEVHALALTQNAKLASVDIAAQYATKAEYLKAGHGKHNVCSHPSTWAARQACRMARRAAAAGVVSTPGVERTITVMHASNSTTTHYIKYATEHLSVTACNGSPIKNNEHTVKPLDYVATCKNCAKLEIMSTDSLSY